MLPLFFGRKEKISVQQAKPGKKLSEIIKPWTDRIYERDKERYNGLCRWVWHQQKAGWPDEAIAKALQMANSNIDQSGDWWKYLTAMMPKAKGKATAEESDGYKKSDLTSVRAILRKIIR